MLKTPFHMEMKQSNLKKNHWMMKSVTRGKRSKREDPKK